MSCAARRACSSAVKGAAVKPSSACATSLRAASKEAASPSRAAPLQRGEGARGLRGGRGAARPLVARREDGPEPGGQRRRSRAQRAPKPRSAASSAAVELLDERGLVGVEQVLLHLEQRLARAEPAAAEGAHGQGGVHARAREAGGLAELAQQQPGGRALGVAGAHARQRDRVGAAQQRGPQPAARGGQGHLVAVRRGALRGGQGGERGAARPQGRRSAGRASSGPRSCGAGAPDQPRRPRAPPSSSSALCASKARSCMLCADLPGRRRLRAAAGAARSASGQPGCRPRRRARSALLDLDVELRRRLRDLARDRLGALLRLRAERVGLLGA